MLTQIEIDGFKTFKDFKVELAPFQVIVGPNGSGKSNLFDALQLLSRLADKDLLTAFQEMRGDAGELFTKYPDGKISDRIRIAVEMLVDRKVEDDLGREVELEYTRLRYELEVSLRTYENAPDELYITHESLRAISHENDNWWEKYKLDSQNKWLSKDSDNDLSIFSFRHTDVGQYAKLELHSSTIDQREEDPLYIADEAHSFQLKSLQCTILSSNTILRLYHASAVRKELQSLKFLHLNTEVLRQPSSANAPRFLSSRGGNLPTTLARMQAEDKFALKDVSLELANLVPDLTSIELKKDEVRNEYSVWAKYQDGRFLSSRVLSDGTLNLLALATLKCDPRFQGVLCFEEPENGIHPSYLTDIARLLRGLVTNFEDQQQIDEPLRQVLVTTHSPTFISQPDTIDALLFTYTMTRVEPLATGIPPMRFTHAAPVLVADTQSHINGVDIDKWEASYTIDLVKDLLTKDHLDEALDRLNKSRTMLDER